MDIFRYVAVTVLGYLLGSFPTGVVAARWITGKDPRQQGSGRTGGTNVLRTAGRIPALLTIIGDLAKGAVAVLLARAIVGGEVASALAGLAAVLGHNRSIFLRFRGGAGSMTNTGVVLALAWYAAPIMGLVAILAARFSRMASVASMAAAGAMLVVFVIAFALGRLPSAYLAYGVAACAMILFELSPNIRRLREGSERKVENF